MALRGFGKNDSYDAPRKGAVAIYHLGGHHRGWYRLARIEVGGFI